MPATDARSRAAAVLERVERGAFCDVLVGETLARGDMDPREAALFVRLAYGTTAWQARLDWTLAGLARRPLDRLDPAVRTALRLGLFQLLRLDRVPAHAAVNASVELAKTAAGAGAASFVNAVLRAAIREGERPPPPEAEGVARALAIRWSHPPWLVERWLAERGREGTERLLEADDGQAPTVLRVDLRRRTRGSVVDELATAGVAAVATTRARAGVAIVGAPRGALALAATAPQGEASQLVADLVGARAGERIADLCAAPGGKSGALAEAMELGGVARGGFVVAADRSRTGLRRVARLARGDDALPDGARHIAPLVADVLAPPFAEASFDGVLLDAPCSGLGTLRSHPEIRWRRTAADVSRLAAVQRAMIGAAAKLVRPGGRLVYATCTLLREENEDVVESLLARQPHWQREHAGTFLPPEARDLVGHDGALRTSPDVDGLDGFFAVRLRRDDGPGR